MLNIDYMLCDSCGTCIVVCSVLALTLQPHILIDHKRCIECGMCVIACPVAALSLKEKNDEQ